MPGAVPYALPAAFIPYIVPACGIRSPEFILHGKELRLNRILVMIRSETAAGHKRTVFF